MGQEIERARALLSALVREGVLPADRAEAAYEAWVAQADIPFSMFLIREGRADPAAVRRSLRIAAVPGMVHPERFTLERFEDLLMGQLGIEAGILSPKLLQTVRGVQDKKLEEGKVRRLEELLPRAGFDPVQLRILREHLAERVLLCAGCLARYPRKEREQVQLDCPRCGERIAAGAVKESDLALLPEPAKRQLLVNSGEGSAVFDTLTVAARERRPSGPPQRTGPPPGLVALALASLLLVAVGAGWALSGKTGPPRRPLDPAPPRPTAAPDGAKATEPAPAGPASTSRAPTYSEAQALDRRWRIEGRWDDLLAMWRRVEPGPGEAAASVRATKAERVAELERRVEHAAEVMGALARARAAPDDEALERALVLAIAGAPADAAPYAAAAAELRARREKRREAARGEALRRLAAARDGPSEAPDLWAARLAQARRSPLAAVEVAGRVSDRVTIERLDERGFAVRGEDGVTRALAWSDDPGLGLLVAQRAARPGELEDHIEVLRRALLARDPRAAETALRALEAPEGALDVGEALAAAATWAAPTVVEGRDGPRWRVRWSTQRVSPDLVIGAGAAAPDALALTGERCELTTPSLEVAQSREAAVELSVRLEGVPAGPFVAAELLGARARRTYLVRWDATSWQLEVDLGAGANVLKRGTLPAQAQAVRVRVTQSELAVLLDGVERASAPVSARFDSVALRAGAAGPLAFGELAVEGALSDGWVERTTTELADRVDERVAALADQLATRGAPALPRLSVEDTQGLAGIPEEILARCDEARRALLGGQVERAAGLLDDVLASAPGLLPALHTRALVANLAGDVHLAVRHLRRALELDPSFAEARALLALTLARAGRRGPASQAANAAITDRPDQAHAHAALACVAWQARALDRPIDPASVREPMRLARALAPADPLVRAVDRTLTRALQIDALISARHVEGGACVLVTEATAARARDVHRTISALASRFERELRPSTPSPLVAAVVPARLGPIALDVPARWDPDLGLVLVRDGTALGWDLAHAVARAFVARAYGTPPPWLEFGLAAALAAPAAGEDPPGFKEVLADAPPWGEEEWQGLLVMRREAVVANTLARAKAWALVTLAQRQAPSWQVLARLLDHAARGEDAEWPGNAPIDLGSLDAQIATGLRRPR